MRFNRASQFMSEFAVRLLRQSVMSTVAKYMAGYIENLPEEEFLSMLETNMVDRLEAELYAKVPREKLEEWAGVARPYVSCFGRDDLGTIYVRLLQRLSPERAQALDQHREWLLGQMEEAWNRLLATLGQEVASATG